MASPPAGLVRVTMRFYFDGKYPTVTFSFIPPGGGVGFDVPALCGVMGEWWEGPGIGPAPPSHWQYQAATLIQVIANLLPAGASPSSRIFFSLLRSVLGSQSEPSVPQSSCPVLRLVTSSPIGRHNGRLYFPGFSSSFLTGDSKNLIDSAIAPDFVDTFDGLQAFLNDAYAPGPAPIWVVWLRRRQVGGPMAMPVVAPVHHTTLLGRQLGSQRLRLQGQHKYDLVPDVP